jgi:hypothetical protein
MARGAEECSYRPGEMIWSLNEEVVMVACWRPIYEDVPKVSSAMVGKDEIYFWILDIEWDDAIFPPSPDSRPRTHAHVRLSVGVHMAL